MMVNSMPTNKWTVLTCLMASFVFLLLSLTVQPAAAKGTHARNDILLGALSPFEDLAEDALHKEINGLQADMAAARTSFRKINEFLSPESFSRLEMLLTDIDASAKARRYDLLSLQSLEAYKVIAMELDRATLKIPIEVVMLDYAGFKIQSLLSQQVPDWIRLNQTVAEARSYWSAIVPKVRHKAVRDAFDTDIEGLSLAITAKNTAMLFFAAQVDLDLVDLLEEYFG